MFAVRRPAGAPDDSGRRVVDSPAKTGSITTMNNGQRAPNQLDRVLGPWSATAIVVGTTIGSGIFKKPAAVSADVPQFGVAMAAWVLLAAVIACGGLALAEVT